MTDEPEGETHHVIAEAEPPLGAGKGRPSAWAALGDAARSNPGKWMALEAASPSAASSAASRLRGRGEYALAGVGELEVAVEESMVYVLCESAVPSATPIEDETFSLSELAATVVAAAEAEAEAEDLYDGGEVPVGDDEVYIDLDSLEGHELFGD